MAILIEVYLGFGDIDLADERIGVHGLPVSHPMGSIAYCYVVSVHTI